MNHQYKAINLSKTNNKKIKERKEKPFELNHTFVSDRVPQDFVQLVKYFYPEAKTIEEYWKMAKIAANRNVCEEKPEVLEIALHSFRQLINKVKTAKVRNPIGYFYGIADTNISGCFMIIYMKCMVVHHDSCSSIFRVIGLLKCKHGMEKSSRHNARNIIIFLL
jgi:hypothetical protein